MTPKVSVIIPVYNVGQYLKECVDSVLNQNFTDFELLLIDDGSTDNSGNICEELAQRDERIKVFHKENGGVSSARNVGIENAIGQYICFIDADDKIDDSMMESYIEIVNLYKPDIITTNIYQYHVGNRQYIEVKNDLPYGQILREDDIVKFFIQPYYGGNLGIIPSPCNKLYRTDFIKNHTLQFDKSLKRAEDYWLNFYAFKKAVSVYAINKSFYHYYSNSGSAMKSFREGQFDNFLKNRKQLIKEYSIYKFPINWLKLNNDFVFNTYELILFAIKNKGFLESQKYVYSYIKNKDFIEILKNSNNKKRQYLLLRFLILNKIFPFAFIIFYLWSLKVK